MPFPIFSFLLHYLTSTFLWFLVLKRLQFNFKWIIDRNALRSRCLLHFYDFKVQFSLFCVKLCGQFWSPSGFSNSRRYRDKAYCLVTWNTICDGFLVIASTCFTLVKSDKSWPLLCCVIIITTLMSYCTKNRIRKKKQFNLGYKLSISATLTKNMTLYLVPSNFGWLGFSSWELFHSVLLIDIYVNGTV